MTFPVSITPRRIVSFYNSSTFKFHALRKACKIPPVFNCSSASNFWGSLADFFLQMMTQHYCLNSRWFNIRCLSNRQLSNSNRWLKENHDVRKTPRSFANMSTCLDTSYTPVLVLSIGFPSLKPSPQLARLFVSVWWCLGCPRCNFNVFVRISNFICGGWGWGCCCCCYCSNRWCRSCCSCCKRYRVFFIASNMYPTTLRLKTGLSKNMSHILAQASLDQDLAEGVTEEEAWPTLFAQRLKWGQTSTQKIHRSLLFPFLLSLSPVELKKIWGRWSRRCLAKSWFWIHFGLQFRTCVNKMMSSDGCLVVE